MNGIAARIAEKIAERSWRLFHDEGERNAFTGSVSLIISTELEPVMEVLREAVDSGQHRVGCAWLWTTQPCNCWVSRAQALIDGEK